MNMPNENPPLKKLLLQNIVHNPPSGFTLLEIIVVIAIIGVLAASATVIFGDFNRKQNLSIAYDNVYNALSEAKSYSLSQVVTHCKGDATLPSFNSTEDHEGELYGYELAVVDDSTYSLSELCIYTGDTTPSVIDPPVKTYTMAPGTTISANGEARFKVLSGGSDSFVTFTITDSDANTRSIRVNGAGAIY